MFKLSYLKIIMAVITRYFILQLLNLLPQTQNRSFLQGILGWYFRIKIWLLGIYLATGLVTIFS